MTGMRVLFVLAAVSLVSGCKVRPTDAPDASSITSAVPVLEASVIAVYVDAGPSAPEVARANGYLDALIKGRRATLSRDWSGAIHAFGEALEFRRGDARAAGERGYAEYLSGDPTDAKSDLELATRATDPKLAAQVWFNLGLVNESTDAEEAGVDFWFSNELHPSGAAKAKIAGREVCPVSVDRKRVPGRLEHVRGSVASALAGCSMLNDAQATPVVTSGPVSVPGQGDFYVVRSGKPVWNGCVITSIAAVQVKGADAWVYEVAGGSVAFASISDDPDVSLERFGDLVHVTVTDAAPVLNVLCAVRGADGGDPAPTSGIFPCTGAPDEVFGNYEHTAAPTEYTDYFLDASAHAVVLTLEDHASGRFAPDAGAARRIALRPDGPTGVRVSGFTCNRTIRP